MNGHDLRQLLKIGPRQMLGKDIHLQWQWPVVVWCVLYSPVRRLEGMM